MKTLALSIAAAVLVAGVANAAPVNAPRPKDLTNPPPKASALLLPARQTIREPSPSRAASFKDNTRTARELGSRAAVGRR